MKEIFIRQGLSDVKEIIGPAMIVWAVRVGKPTIHHSEETQSPSISSSSRLQVKVNCLPDVSIGYWDDFKSKFGF